MTEPILPYDETLLLIIALLLADRREGANYLLDEYLSQRKESQ